MTLGGAAVALTGTLGHRTPAPSADPGILDFAYDGARRGVLLEPSPAHRAHACPLIVLFDPLGDARGIVARYALAARDRGWVAASTNDAANGTSYETVTALALALVDAVRARLPVDPDRVYAGGFSGGGCNAYRLAIVKREVVRGAIVECGHMAPWRDVGDMAQASSRFFLFTRADDFNRPATRQLRDAMVARRCGVEEVELPGGHMPMEPAEVGRALDWLDRT